MTRSRLVTVAALFATLVGGLTFVTTIAEPAARQEAIVFAAEPPDAARTLYPAPPHPLSLKPIAVLQPRAEAASGAFATAVAASNDTEGARFAVADRWDGAVHVYSDTGTYLLSISDGPRDRSTLYDVYSLAFGANHTIYASSLTWGTIARFTLTGERIWARRLTPMAPGTITVSDIAIASDGRVFDHWLGFLPPGGRWRGPWNAAMPLVRIYDDDGARVGGVAGLQLVQAEGEVDVLTPLLNQGRIFLDGDTLWFAQRRSALLRAFVKTSEGHWRQRREIGLPVFFKAPPPRQFSRPTSDQYGHQTHPHLIDIDRVAGLGWIAIQATQYPSDRLSPPLAVLIAGYDDNGVLLGAFKVDGQPSSIAASRRGIVLTVAREGVSGSIATLYRNPFPV